LNLELEAYIIEVIYRCYTLVVVEERFPDTIVKRKSLSHSFIRHCKVISCGKNSYHNTNESSQNNCACVVYN